MRKIVIIYGVLVVVVIALAVWRLGLIGRIANLGGNGGDETQAEAVIGETTVELAVADEPDERALGLGDYESLGENQGMLFVFDEAGEQTFWMLGVEFPIDIIWLDGETIVHIEENVPGAEEDAHRAALPRYVNEEPADRVIEVPAGFVEANNVAVGDTVEISGL